MKNLSLILGSMLGIFVLIEHQNLWNNGSLILANIAHDSAYYQGDSKWVIRYNEAIWLSQNGKYTEAKFLLTPLLNDMSISKKAEVSELYGDLIYSSSGSIQDTLRMYERSLEFRASERVSKKIAYIKKMNPEKQLALTGSQSETSGKTDSGSLEKNAKKEELIKTGEKQLSSTGSKSETYSGKTNSGSIQKNTKKGETIKIGEKQLSLSGSKSETSSGKIDSGSLEKNAKKEELIKIGEKRAEYLGSGIPGESFSRNELQKLIESAQSGSIEIAQDW